ncbi:MAG: bifunctional phosphopantothenoylcysteine decarboxylase/phosphopantothenate--cysteine ligase CoaBC [Armatimonadota bacterium]|nr:bifunctional phosphopantothenoylcysteine decarboxylase/phosphopantothenate--cysteine ligase CoaBC [Armatimonadota bacterium]MCX7776465.1 bifunctional phosphopantothenoylcysteine decarboxylase/phosphopantothenate--cysteine ligase CoaBC [Armatimonadota bacterium]MDW8024263.1 bifunctional phosphopantothenoylcysteine decarboxylase/phosphopantothenate--cysteine ligase CoaBC [Armatimonadota bacterium]
MRGVVWHQEGDKAVSDLLEGKRILIGITGSIAAFKAAQLVSHLRQRGASVHVVMTRHGAALVAPLTFATLSGNPVFIDPFENPSEPPLAHIELAKSADVVVVAPATANIIAKMAHGIADDLLSTTLLAVRCPIIVAPAMDADMYEHPATQTNLGILKDRGVTIVEPDVGWLASGRLGKGRLAPVERIIEAIERAIKPPLRDLEGVRMLITAGATREPIDAVRFLSNPSTGKMGCAIASAAIERGAAVTLVCGHIDVTPPKGAKVINVTTTRQMLCSILDELSKENYDVVIGAGAPCDFRPVEVTEGKLKRAEHERLRIELEPTPDIMAAVRERYKDLLLIGFAAEYGEPVAGATEKMHRKGLDMVVANDITRQGAGFGVDTNIVTIIRRDGVLEDLPIMSKLEVAHRLLNHVREMLIAKGTLKG